MNAYTVNNLSNNQTMESFDCFQANVLFQQNTKCCYVQSLQELVMRNSFF